MLQYGWEESIWMEEGKDESFWRERGSFAGEEARESMNGGNGRAKDRTQQQHASSSD